MTGWMIAGIVLVLAGSAFTGAGLSILRRDTPRSGGLGFRESDSLRDPMIWLPVQVTIGLGLIWAGVLAISIGILLLILGDSDGAARWILGIGVPALVICLITGFYRAWRTARAIDARQHQVDTKRPPE